MIKAETTISDAAKKEIDRHFSDFFFGMARNLWISGKTLGESWVGAAGMAKSFLAAKTKSNPNNPAIQHMNEYFAKNIAKFLEYAKTIATRNDKMKIPPQQLAEYQAMGAKWTNEGMNGLNRHIKTAVQAQNTNLLPIQIAIMRRQNYRSAA
jgi:hypothetical protein